MGLRNNLIDFYLTGLKLKHEELSEEILAKDFNENRSINNTLIFEGAIGKHILYEELDAKSIFSYFKYIYK